MAPNRCLAVERAKKYQGKPGTKPQGIPIPGSEREGRSAVYRHWQSQDQLLETLDPSVTTLHDAFEQSAKRVPRNKCLGMRPYDPVAKTFGDYVWEDYQTIQRRRANFGVGLVSLHEQIGVTGRQYGVGLWCQNRPEWQITDLACMSQSLYSVSIYDTLGPESTEYIVNHAGLACVVTSLNHITTLLKLKPRLPTLKLIVSADPLDAGEQPGSTKADLLNSLAGELGVKVVYIRDVEAIGDKSPRPYNPPTPDDIITINYTSGTTGNPKGVVLTQKNALSAASVSLVVVKETSAAQDIICSFLPLAHIYQRLGEHAALWSGVAIAYFHGNILELVDDLKLVRPTAFSGVPRLYNRFGGKIKEATVEAPGLRGALSRRAVATKLAAVNDPDESAATNRHAFWDRIWARKVSAALGLDRCYTMVSGSAPIDPSLHQFLRAVFANNFLQGYGLTESYAVALAQVDGDVSPGNCGPPTPNAELCLRDVPDMEYLSTDRPNPRGELLIRGPSVFREYHRNAAETAKVVDGEGWFATGDIAEVDGKGRFRIVDRVKNVLKLAQGEYISPERIENVYLANCGWLATAYVHGDSHQSSLVAVLGVMPDSFPAFASRALGRKVPAEDLAAALAEKKLERAVLAELDRIGRKNKFNSYERVRGVRLLIDPFTVDNELLTPTLKMKRPQVAKRFREDLDAMYDEVTAEDAARPKAKL